MVVGQWGDISFEISASDAILFRDLKLSASAETEDRTENGQKYAGYKNGKAITASMTILLHAGLGNDVRNTIMLLQDAAQRGTQDYLVIGKSKLYPFKMMLTKAEADKILISPLGEWVSSEVSVSWSQSSPEHIFETEAESVPWVDSGSGAGGGSGGKDRVKTDEKNSSVKEGIGWLGKVVSEAKETKPAVNPSSKAQGINWANMIASITKKD